MPIASVTKRAMLATSPPAYTRAALVAWPRSVSASAPSASSDRLQRREFRILADRRDDGVRGEREFAAGDRRRRVNSPRCAARARSARARTRARRPCRAASRRLRQHRAVDERDAFLQRLHHLFALRGHLRFALERDDRHLVARRGARCARRRARRCRRRSPRRGGQALAARRRWRARGSRRRPAPTVAA